MFHDQGDTTNILRAWFSGQKPKEFDQWGLHPVNPFWTDLLHCDIFSCITPDILHQLHKGVFKDHLVKWATACVDGKADEIDRHFKVMMQHSNLYWFKKGISLVSQWTGTEYKNMEKVFMGIIAGTADTGVLHAVCAIFDFIYFAHFEVHTESSLQEMENALAAFHSNKDIFIMHSICKYFNIAKLHSTGHYAQLIHLLGTADGYSTEGPERLYIDYAKLGYKASNRKRYIQ